MQSLTNLGFKMSPYLAVEAHLISCGGFKTQGHGPFDIKKALAWLLKRSLKVMPNKPDETAQLVKRERHSAL